MKKVVFLLLITFAACKNNAQKIEPLNETNKVLTRLPSELANKTWVVYSGEQEENYKTLLENLNSDSYPLYVKTGDITFAMVEGDIETYLLELQSNEITKTKDTYKIQLNSQFVDYIILEWFEKTRGILSIEYHYKTLPESITDSIFTIKYVSKDFITPENFPETEKSIDSEAAVESEKIIDGDKYKRVDDLPIKGKFKCNNNGSISFFLLKLRKTNLYDNDGNIEEVQPYEAIISLDEFVNIVCSLRKVANTTNKYALLYRHTKNTKFHPEDKLHYSKTHPIAEVEILDDNTIKKKWLGIYNRRTKKMENYGQQYGWEDKCNGVIKRVEKF